MLNETSAKMGLKENRRDLRESDTKERNND
jgi:hypothetical protein